MPKVSGRADPPGADSPAIGTGVVNKKLRESLIQIKVAVTRLFYGYSHNNSRGEESMTGGETVFLIGVIAAFVAFSAVLAYSQIMSGGPKP